MDKTYLCIINIFIFYEILKIEYKKKNFYNINIMEDFEYTYEDDDYYEQCNKLNLQLNTVSVNIEKFLYKPVLNDIEDLKKNTFEESIYIESVSDEILNIKIYDREHILIANFNLFFNNKYPFGVLKKI
jgi:hypothetical protein